MHWTSGGIGKSIGGCFAPGGIIGMPKRYESLSNNIQDIVLPLDCSLDQDQWLELEDLSVPVVYVWFDYYV
jgi:hypothetical protein